MEYLFSCFLFHLPERLRLEVAGGSDRCCPPHSPRCPRSASSPALALWVLPRGCRAGLHRVRMLVLHSCREGRTDGQAEEGSGLLLHPELSARGGGSFCPMMGHAAPTNGGGISSLWRGPAAGRGPRVPVLPALCSGETGGSLVLMKIGPRVCFHIVWPERVFFLRLFVFN